MPKQILVLILTILVANCLLGCATISNQVKEIAIASAEKAASRAIASGKIALSDLVIEADASIRQLGSDFVAAAKEELATSGQIAAFKISEHVGEKFRESVPEPISDATNEAILSYLKSQNVVKESPVGTITATEKPMTTFQQILAGLAGLATLAGTVVTASTMNDNKHRKKRDTSIHKQQLAAAPSPEQAEVIAKLRSKLALTNGSPND